VAPLAEADAHALTLAVSRSYREALARTRAGAVLVSGELADAPGPGTRIVVADPARAMARVVERLFPAPVAPPGVHPTAVLGRGVALGADVSVGPYVVVGERVRIGARTRLGPGVVLEDDVTLGDDCHLAARVVCCHGVQVGDRVRVKPGAVLGGIGFGFHSGPDGHRRVPHVGGLRIADDVEIGANSTVDRGSLGDTVVGHGTKIDNMVHVGHNCRIGAHCILAGGVMVAGSVQTGDFVIFGGASGAIDHVRLGMGARVGAGSAVFADVPPGQTVSGFPAQSHRETLRAQAAVRRLPPLMRRLERLAERDGPDA
jgi:UDP-3-O-[3-hydroxymyristoyl] glucosamine N-acyltransferase